MISQVASAAVVLFDFYIRKKTTNIIKDSALERQETRPEKGRDQELFIFSPVYGVV